MTQIITLTHDELLNAVRNDVTFHIRWLSLAQRYLPTLFVYTRSPSMQKGHELEIKFNGDAGFLGYRPKEILRMHLGELFRSALLRILPQISRNNGGAEIRCPHRAEDAICADTLLELVTEIQRGAIQLPEDVNTALHALYVTKTSVAHVMRLTGKSRGAINKLKETYSVECYDRYCQVQQGTPYATVMGAFKPGTDR